MTFDLLAALSLSSPIEPPQSAWQIVVNAYEQCLMDHAYVPHELRAAMEHAKSARPTPQASSEVREAYWQEFLEARGVETPCKKCGGTGTVVYGSTATWRGGIGGAAVTNGICDRCWGSGDENKHWTDLRALAPSRQGAAKRVEG